MKKSQIILISIAVVALGIQLIRPERAPQTAITDAHIFKATNTPADVQQILRSACFDCHSDSVRYPWYSNVAPVSFLVAHDVNEGREHLNFSQWGTYSAEDQSEMLHHAHKAVTNGWMPMAIYVAMHSEANLSAEQVKTLGDWLNATAEGVGTNNEAKNDSTAVAAMGDEGCKDGKKEECEEGKGSCCKEGGKHH